MRKDNYRKILSEKFRAANQLETDHLTEEDEEYLLILAEARANHARIKADRQAARKRLAARVAAVLMVAALVSSSYLLGMKSDSKASADPDDEVNVVQQGDNIIIGPGVSEEDENVGVKVRNYFNVNDIPAEIKEQIIDARKMGYKIQRVKVVENEDGDIARVTTYLEDEELIAIVQNQGTYKLNTQFAINELEDEWTYNGHVIRKGAYDNGNIYHFIIDDVEIAIIVRNEWDKIKIEVLLNDLAHLE